MKSRVSSAEAHDGARQRSAAVSSMRSQTNDSRWVWWSGVMLVAITVAVYSQVRHYGFLLYDDADYVTRNPMVQSGLTWKGLRWAFVTEHAANWHPLTWLSHMMDVRLFGTSAAGPHIVNVLLHGANAVLVLIVLRQLTGAVWRSAIVAAVFALHPLRVESVAWVAERKDVLCAFFFLLTLVAWTAYVARKCRAGSPDPAVAVPSSEKDYAADPNHRPDTAGSGLPSVASAKEGDPALQTTVSPSLSLSPSLRYAASLVFFAAALLSKPMAVTLPFVLLLLDFWPLQRIEIRAGRAVAVSTLTRAVLEKLPFFVLSALSCVMTYAAQNNAGVVRSLSTLSLAARFENTVVSYGRYLAKLVWPSDLAVLYPHPGHWPVAYVLGAAALLLGVCAVAVVYWRKYPFVIVGWLWFLGMLVPTIGLVQVSEQSMADRYSYLPSIGVLMAAVWSAEALIRHRVPKVAVATVVGLLLGLCAVGTHLQLRYWRDSESLFRHTVAVTRENFAAMYNIGGALLEQGQVDDAILEFRKALAIRPTYADARCNLAAALLRKNQIAEAVTEFRRAIADQPRHVLARCNLGLVLQQQGQIDEAIRQFQAVADLGREGAIGHFYLGNVRLSQGEIEQAIAQYEQALAIDPDNAEAHNNLAAALLRVGRATEALRQFAQALELRPTDPDTNSNLADVLLQRGLTAQAADRYRLSLAHQPRNPEAHCGLGTALLLLGKTDEAMTQFEQALVLQPDSAIAHNNLAGILLRKGRSADAVAHLRAALKIQPDNVRTLTSLAWVLATCADDAVRDGASALELAERAARSPDGADPRVLRALAAAYAETGKFAAAAATAQQAMQLAEAASDAVLAATLRSQLQLYEAGKPFHDAPPANGR